MKNIQPRVEKSVDEFIGKLQAVVGEFAVEAIEERLTKRRRKQRAVAIEHRRPEEISALQEALYAGICQQPGATMVELSKGVGEKSSALAVPMRKLLASGRVKKTGQSLFTRYFPIGRQVRSTRQTTRRKRSSR